MQIVATTDFHLGLRENAEVIYRGTTFTPPGTGIMSSADQARSLINCGSCCLPSDWEKVQKRTQAGYDWAKAEVARERAAQEARQAARATLTPGNR